MVSIVLVEAILNLGQKIKEIIIRYGELLQQPINLEQFESKV